MQIEQRFQLPLAPADAWPAFHDIALLVECLPGASLTGPAEGGEVPLRFDVKLGPIAAGFVGAGKVSFDEAARAGRFEGAAADRKTNSRVKGAADFSLQEHRGGTLVTVLVDYTLSGALAQFGRAGIVRELATALTAQFAANLERRLTAATPAMTGQPQPLAPHPHTLAAAPLGGGSLLLQVLRARWARLTQRLTFGRSR
jgi:carbon monoxide dehydrogenase subunit G